MTITQPTYPITTSNLVTYLGAYSDTKGAWVDVRDYGAVGNFNPTTQTGTDCTTAFTNAIAAAASTTGVYGGVGGVFVPGGNWLVQASALNSLPNRISLVGTGMGTTLFRKQGTNGPFIRNNTTAARQVTVANMRIDGQSSVITDTTADGLVFDAPDPQGSAEFVDGRHFAHNVHIQNTGRSGFVHLNRGVAIVSNVATWNTGGHGFDVNLDSHYANCDSGRAGWDGFMIRSGGNTFVGCKAWFSGAVSTTGNSEVDGTGHGFHFQSGNYSANDMSGCSAQDNGRAGFCLRSCGRQVLAGCDADSNNSLNLSAAGVELSDSWGNSITGMNSWDRAANATPQLAALRIIAGGGNVVHITSDGTMTQGRLTNDSDASGSEVKIGAAGGIQAVAYANPLLVDSGYYGGNIAVTLTGAMLVSAPTEPYSGQVLRFLFKQDATGGRVVTWNAIFKVNWTPTTTANKINTITFIYDGTNWVQISSATGL